VRGRKAKGTDEQGWEDAYETKKERDRIDKGGDEPEEGARNQELLATVIGKVDSESKG
jgi:hypothetical protein